MPKFRKDDVKNGITDIVRYNISPNSSAALRKVDGRAEARIIQMACSPAPEGHLRWTLRLLEEKAHIELDVPAGREAIRQTLKKMNFDLTKTPAGASHPKKTQNLQPAWRIFWTFMKSHITLQFQSDKRKTAKAL